MNNLLIEHIQRSELVQAAITEAVHRFYHDRILSDDLNDHKDLEETDASNILSNLWNLMPNWRYVIQKRLRRYSLKISNTSSVSIDGKPKQVKPFTIQIEIK